MFDKRFISKSFTLLCTHINLLFSIESEYLKGVPEKLGGALGLKVEALGSKNFGKYTLQEMCCGFLLSREMWYHKSVLPGTGAG